MGSVLKVRFATWDLPPIWPFLKVFHSFSRLNNSFGEGFFRKCENSKCCRSFSKGFHIFLFVYPGQHPNTWIYQTRNWIMNLSDWWTLVYFNLTKWKGIEHCMIARQVDMAMFSIGFMVKVNHRLQCATVYN